MKWTFWHSISLPLSVGLILLLGFLLPADQLLMIWILIMIIIIVTLLILGQGITGFWKGVLIDEDNHISLSRFQLLCWMVLVLSAFLASAIMNIRIGNCDALSITLPTELWILLGISTTSLVGSPLIKNTKKEKRRLEVKPGITGWALINGRNKLTWPEKIKKVSMTMTKG